MIWTIWTIEQNKNHSQRSLSSSIFIYISLTTIKYNLKKTLWLNNWKFCCCWSDLRKLRKTRKENKLRGEYRMRKTKHWSIQCGNKNNNLWFWGRKQRRQQQQQKIREKETKKKRWIWGQLIWNDDLVYIYIYLTNLINNIL